MQLVQYVLVSELIVEIFSRGKGKFGYFHCLSCVCVWVANFFTNWARKTSLGPLWELVNVFTNFAHEGGTSAAVVYGATNISLALLEWNLIFYIIFYLKKQVSWPPTQESQWKWRHLPFPLRGHLLHVGSYGIEFVVSMVSVIILVKLAFVVNGALLALVFVTAVVCGN